MVDDRLALDRSVRSVDQDGHLRVAVSNLSKSNVCEYRGAEIPDHERLGLDANRLYKLLRDPIELAKSAASWHSKPVLALHRPIASDNHPHKIVVGALGNDVRFEDPYLRGSLTVWDQDAIDLIENGEQKEISLGYRYDADVAPGVHDGVPYDIVMRNIRANHCALVSTGRAGPDVVVGDSAPKVVPAPAARGAKFAAALDATLPRPAPAPVKFRTGAKFAPPPRLQPRKATRP